MTGYRMGSRTLATLVVVAALYRTVYCAEPFSGLFFDGEASADSGLEKIQLLDIARRSLGEVRTPTNTLFMLISGSVCSICTWTVRIAVGQGACLCTTSGARGQGDWAS